MNRFFSIACLLVSLTFVSFTLIQNQVELETKAVLGGKMDMLLPKNFETLQEDKIKADEDANIVYENENRTISLTFNYSTGAANQEIIPAFLDGFASSIDASYQIEKWIDKKIVEANGHKIGKMEYTTKEEGADGTYYMTFFTDIDGRLLVATFNCGPNDKEEWAPLANKMINSIKVK